MKRIPDVQTQVSLDSIGDVTKSRWFGTFLIRRKLTHADRFLIERIYNQMIPKGGDVLEDLKIRAATLAELQARVISGPDWWESSGRMQLLLDAQPIYDLIALCSKAEADWEKELEDESKVETSNVITDKSN